MLLDRATGVGGTYGPDLLNLEAAVYLASSLAKRAQD